MSKSIVFDDRENDLWDTATNFDNCQRSRLEVFDIIIFYETVMLAAIERKTWRDLAASLKDGRLHSQGLAQQQLWQSRGCKFLRILLIEGNRGTEHCGIPSKNLATKVDHMCYRREWDMVIYTKNPEHSVLRILELAANFPTDLAPEYGYTSQDEQKTGGSGITPAERAAIAEQRYSVPATAVRALLQVPGISQATAASIKTQGWSIMDMYNMPDPTPIQNLVYPSGSLVGPDRAKKIYNAFGVRRVWVAIISEVRGVSRAVAEAILEQLPIPGDWTVANLAAVTKTTGGRSVGPTVAERIIQTISFRF